MSVPVEEVTTRTYTVPTDHPESDGTLEWRATTMVMAEVRAGGTTGLGWTYASRASQTIIEDILSEAVVGADLLGTAGAHEGMVRACRNIGRPGAVSCAVSAVDIALWDCKARHLGVPLADLFGRCGDEVAIYGSGGFLTYDDETARAQLEQWVAEWDISRVKIKIGEAWGGRPERTWPEPRSPGRSSVTMSHCLSTPTAPTAESRRCALAVSWPTQPASPGSKSLCHRTISSACDSSGTHSTSMLLQESTAMTRPTLLTWWPRAPWTASRST